MKRIFIFLIYAAACISAAQAKESTAKCDWVNAYLEKATVSCVIIGKGMLITPNKKISITKATDIAASALVASSMNAIKLETLDVSLDESFDSYVHAEGKPLLWPNIDPPEKARAAFLDEISVCRFVDWEPVCERKKKAIRPK